MNYQARAIPDLQLEALLPLFGPMAVPLIVSHHMFRACAEASAVWSKACFVPHDMVMQPGANLSIPEPLNLDHEHHELFA